MTIIHMIMVLAEQELVAPETGGMTVNHKAVVAMLQSVLKNRPSISNFAPPQDAHGPSAAARNHYEENNIT